MFKVTYIHTPTSQYTTKVHGQIDLRFPDLETFDVVCPSIGDSMAISFSNDGGLTLFQYEPLRYRVLVYEYNKGNQLKAVHEYKKVIGCGSSTQLNSTYLWKKLFIPFTFKNGTFILDRKKLMRKKRKVYTVEEFNLCAKDKKTCGFVLTKVCSRKCNGFIALND